MKKLALGIILIFFGISVYGQNIGNYLKAQNKVIKKKKTEFIKEIMDFTDEEAKVFWPLYEEYTAKTNIYHTMHANVITYYVDHFEDLTSEKAEWVATNYQKANLDLQKLKSKYFNKFAKVIGPVKALRFTMIENRIERRVMEELQIELPLAGELEN